MCTRKTGEKKMVLGRMCRNGIGEEKKIDVILATCTAKKTVLASGPA
jgi:hypothetical protein